MKQRSPCAKKHVSGVGKPGDGPKERQTAPEQGQRIYEPPLLHKAEMHCSVRQVQQGLAEVRNDRVAEGRDSHGAAVANPQRRPEPFPAVTSVHPRGHQRAQQDMNRVKGPEETSRNLPRQTDRDREDYDQDPGDSTESRKGRVRSQLCGNRPRGQVLTPFDGCPSTFRRRMNFASAQAVTRPSIVISARRRYKDRSKDSTQARISTEAVQATGRTKRTRKSAVTASTPRWKRQCVIAASSNPATTPP
jgi:hypothetical protein